MNGLLQVKPHDVNGAFLKDLTPALRVKDLQLPQLPHRDVLGFLQEPTPIATRQWAEVLHEPDVLPHHLMAEVFAFHGPFLNVVQCRCLLTWCNQSARDLISAFRAVPQRRP